MVGDSYVKLNTNPATSMTPRERLRAHLNLAAVTFLVVGNGVRLFVAHPMPAGWRVFSICCLSIALAIYVTMFVRFGRQTFRTHID